MEILLLLRVLSSLQDGSFMRVPYPKGGGLEPPKPPPTAAPAFITLTSFNFITLPVGSDFVHFGTASSWVK